MKITIGIDGYDTPEQLARFADNGVDEFFAGYTPPAWFNRFGWEMSLNRREDGAHSQFTDPTQLREAINTIHDCGKEIAVTLNAHEYCAEQMPVIRDIVADLEALEPDAYVVADPGLMQALRDWGVARPLHLSACASCFNSETVRHFVNRFGVERIILPRKMSIREIGTLIGNCNGLDVEFEAMVIGYRCFFNDGLCFSWHSEGGTSLCQSLSSPATSVWPRFPADWKERLPTMIAHAQTELSEGSTMDHFVRELKSASARWQRSAHSSVPQGQDGMSGCLAEALFSNCGLCSIPALADCGVSVLKVPGRGEPFSKREYLRVVNAVARGKLPPAACRELISSTEFCETTGSCYYTKSEG